MAHKKNCAAVTHCHLVVSCFIKIQNSYFAIFVRTYLSCHGKEAVYGIWMLLSRSESIQGRFADKVTENPGKIGNYYFNTVQRLLKP